MKLREAGLIGVVLSGAVASVGCGPGLGHHGRWAKAPAQEAASVTTLTGSTGPLPAVPPSPYATEAASWDEGLPDPALRTWGAPPKPEDKYGF